MAARKAMEMVPTMLRMRESLRKRLERAAERNDRSMNAEMVDRLERSLRDEELLTKISNQLATMEEKQAAMMEVLVEKQGDHLQRLFEQWKEDEDADQLADMQKEQWEEDQREREEEADK
jgi:hypothetical protein